jgi:hypothetical protein
MNVVTTVNQAVGQGIGIGTDAAPPSFRRVLRANQANVHSFACLIVLYALPPVGVSAFAAVYDSGA